VTFLLRLNDLNRSINVRTYLFSGTPTLPIPSLCHVPGNVSAILFEALVTNLKSLSNLFQTSSSLAKLALAKVASST